MLYRRVCETGKQFHSFSWKSTQLIKKVETGEFIPKLQASLSSMCKFFTAYYVINGIRHVISWPTTLPDVHYTCQILSGHGNATKSVEFH